MRLQSGLKRSLSVCLPVFITVAADLIFECGGGKPYGWQVQCLDEFALTGTLNTRIGVRQHITPAHLFS